MSRESGVAGPPTSATGVDWAATIDPARRCLGGGGHFADAALSRTQNQRHRVFDDRHQIGTDYAPVAPHALERAYGAIWLPGISHAPTPRTKRVNHPAIRKLDGHVPVAADPANQARPTAAWSAGQGGQRPGGLGDQCRVRSGFGFLCTHARQVGSWGLAKSLKTNWLLELRLRRGWL